jgi:alpha-L-rhamnosidase
MSVQIAQVTAEHHESGFALDTPSPRLSWRFKETEAADWVQIGYEIQVKREQGEEVY